VPMVKPARRGGAVRSRISKEAQPLRRLVRLFPSLVRAQWVRAGKTPPSD
jgi:hypothetical protein